MVKKHVSILISPALLVAIAADNAARRRPSTRRGARSSQKSSRCRPRSAITRCPRWRNTWPANSAPRGFPAEDVTVVPFNMPADKTAALVVRYRGDGTGGKPILLLAHMDVVTAKRVGLEARSVQAHRGKRLLLRARHVRREARHRRAHHGFPAPEGREVRAEARPHHLLQRRRGNLAGDDGRDREGSSRADRRGIRAQLPMAAAARSTTTPASRCTSACRPPRRPTPTSR